MFVKFFGSTKKRRTGCGLHSLVKHKKKRSGWIKKKKSLCKSPFVRVEGLRGRTGDVAPSGARSAIAADFAGKKFVSHPPSPALRTWYVGMRVAGRDGELRGHGVRGLDDQGVCLKEE